LVTSGERSGRNDDPGSAAALPFQPDSSQRQALASRHYRYGYAVRPAGTDPLHFDLERNRVARADARRTGDPGDCYIGLHAAPQYANGTAGEQIRRDLAMIFDLPVRHYDQGSIRS
jgi:hypothetical protein